MKLPYLEDNKWPISKEPEERVVNPSHDAQLQDHLVDQLLRAIETKNHPEVLEAIQSLILAIMNEEPKDDEGY